MRKLEAVIHHLINESLREEGFQRILAEGIFTEWRDNYFGYLGQMVRLVNDAKRVNYATPSMLQLRDWANAAMHLLTVPGPAFQDYFLRADTDLKNRLVRAVLEDGGIENLEGFFVELPPL